MTTSDRGRERLIIGAGGLLLLVALFLPWASVGGVDRSGFELFAMADLYLLIVALIALVAALTGGRIGLFRPDVSFNGAADMLAVIATVLLVWFLAFDFPEGAGREVGAFLALIGAAVAAGGAGDYRVLRGAPTFPRLDDDERRSP